MGTNAKPVTALVIGLGNRGETYSSYAFHHPERLSIVGIADPKPHLRSLFAQKFSKTIDETKVFADWRDIFKNNEDKHEKIADCAIITLPDKLHKEAAVMFLQHDYHILLEKPMATSLDDCRQIALECDKRPYLINAVCHVLRYYDAYIKMKQIIDSGLIGNVVNITQTEPVGHWHFAHSFVRGNWRNEEQSTFSLLAKCCHDIDVLYYLMSGKRCTKVTSFGSLVHFRQENAPKNSTNNCFTCPVEAECPYSTKKIYLSNPIADTTKWPLSIVLDTDVYALNETKDGVDIEDLLNGKNNTERLKLVEKCLSNPNSRYGRCVYRCDNDVCDNQVVIMNFDDNSTATLTMIAYTNDVCARKTRVYGSKGELEWDAAKSVNEITHIDFVSGKKQVIDAKADTIFQFLNDNTFELNKAIARMSGHHGTDYILMNSFVHAIINNDKSYVLTDVNDSFKSHSIVFAAELSRVNNKVVTINEDNTFSY